MNIHIAEAIRRCLGPVQVTGLTVVQALWADQGQLYRVAIDLPDRPSVIVKCIAPDASTPHPRGWHSRASNARKAYSYQVECRWYRDYAQRCNEYCKVPALLGLEQDEQVSILVLEDLAPGWPRLPQHVSLGQVDVCLSWLAEFHALYLFDDGRGLWDQGCYWHLATRQDEWRAMPQSSLKEAAGWLDERLTKARFRTLVHGDAKLANFCFSENLDTVAAVDLQYVGRGCGMSDVVYLLGSCLSGEACADNEGALLDTYFLALRKAILRLSHHDERWLIRIGSWIEPATVADGLEEEWRSLYAAAWADFDRFLLGWMPGHRKLNRYSASLVKRALADRC